MNINTPLCEYQYINTIKANEVQWAGGTSFTNLTYDQLKSNLIKIIKKKISKGKLQPGDAIIIHTADESGDLIKFNHLPEAGQP